MPFPGNVIFMISVRSSLNSDSFGFVSFNNTSKICLVFSKSAAGFPVLVTLKFYKALLLSSECPTFYEHFFSLQAWIPRLQDQWSEYHVISWHCQALVSRQPTFAFLCVSMHQTYASTYLATHCRVLRSFVSSSVSPPTMYTVAPFRLSKLGMVTVLAPLFGRNGPLWEVWEIEIPTRDRRGKLISIPFLGWSPFYGGQKTSKC